MTEQQTLAQAVRAKYPGAYDDLSDQELEAKVKAKYPGTYDDMPTTPAGGTQGRSVTSRAVGGVLTGSGVAGLPALITGAVTSPIQTAKDIAVGLVSPLQRLRNIPEAYRQGGLTGAANEAAASLPILGPAAEQASLRMKSGDVAGGLGEVVGLPLGVLVGPKVVAKGAKTAASRVSPPVKPPIPMTVAERGGGKIATFAERVAERTIPGSGVFERFRQTQQTAIRQLADDVVAKVSPIKGTAEEVGMHVQRALDDAKKATDTKIRAQYDEVDALTRTRTVRRPVTRDVDSRIIDPSTGKPAMVARTTQEKSQVGGVMVPTVTLKQAAIPLLKRLREEAKIIPPDVLTQTSSMLERLINAPKRLSFRAFQDARSDLIALSGSFGEPIPGRSAGMAKQFTKLTDDAMMKAASESGIPGLVEKVRDANTAWRTFKDTFNDTVIKKLIDAAPEKVSAYVQSAELADIRRLANTVPAETMGQVRATLIQDMLNKSTKGELGAPGGLMEQAGITPHGRAPVRPPTLSGQSLKQQMEELGAEKLTTLYGANAAKELLVIADLAERVGPKASNMIPGLFAGGVNVAIFSPIMSAVSGVPGLSLGRAAVTAGSMNALARLLVRQPSQRLMYRQFLSALQRGDSKQAMTYGIILSRALDKEEPQQ